MRDRSLLILREASEHGPITSQEDAIRSGDSRVFDRLHTDLAPRVRGFFRRLTQSNAEAEDLTQDAFIAAYASRSIYRGAQPIAWLIGIARRRWRDDARKGRPPMALAVDDSASAQDLKAEAVRAAHLRSCLDQIEDANRNALMLVFGQGLTYAEAASVLDEPIGTVKWRVHAALRQMRVLLTA